MKKDWTYKKLGEVCETTSGGTPSKSKMEYYENGDIPWLRSGELSNGEIYSTELCITQKGLDNSSAKIIPAGTVSIAMYGATVGEVGIIKKPMCTNQAICNILPNEQFIPNFIRYVLVAYKPKFISLATGGAQPNISQNIIKNTSIPIPPLAIQRSIVAELDLHHSVIEKKQEQLRALDNLAQSLFYQMFGDPITNPMGWEIKKLGEVAENCDYMRKPITASDRIPGNIPYYGASGIVDYVRDYIFDGDYLLVSEDGANLLARSTPIAFSISGKNWVNNHAHVLKFQESYTQLYVQTLINLIDISDIVTGAVQPKLNQAQLNKFPLPLPPLSLQQSFAAKVSAIEAQKQAITQSIKDVESLLAQRMDHYFG